MHESLYTKNESYTDCYTEHRLGIECLLVFELFHKLLIT